MTTFSKIVFGIIAGIAAFFIINSAKAAETLRYQCQSRELGIMEITMSNPTKDGINTIHHNVVLQRFDHNRRLIETRRAPDESGKSEDWFFARQYSGESIVSFDFPVTHVDWSKNSKKCWVNGAFAGGAIEFDVTTGKTVRSGRQVYYIMQELNPEAEYRWVDGWPFRVLVPFVNGTRCDNTSTFQDLGNDLNCHRLN